MFYYLMIMYYKTKNWSKAFNKLNLKKINKLNHNKIKKPNLNKIHKLRIKKFHKILNKMNKIGHKNINKRKVRIMN